MPKILVLEDEENIRELICYALSAQGFETIGREHPKGFIDLVKSENPDLILLDIMLPEEDGLSVLSKIRQNTGINETPVIMLTAKTSEFDRVTGLDKGADDYITKPFSVLELVARVKAMLRRTGKKEKKSIITASEIKMDIERRSVWAMEEDVVLTLKEFDLLKILLENSGRVVTRDRIIESVWGWSFEGESRTVDMHIKTLRQKLGKCGGKIETVRGVGYKIEQ